MKTFVTVFRNLKIEMIEEGFDISKFTKHGKRYMRRELKKLL